MVASAPTYTVTWEKLPNDFVLDDEPVDNINQPLIAAALTESLELADRLPPTALTTTNYGICATVNGQTVVKAPDWGYVPLIQVSREAVKRSYTPHLEGEVPILVMEFLSDTEGGEYSSKPTYPPGKWFFYEQILKVPNYVIFQPDTGAIEVYRLDNTGGYDLQPVDEKGRYWIPEMKLFLGTWQGSRENRTGYWLRWWDAEGSLLLWRSEMVDQARQQVEQERQRAEQERQARRDAIPRLLGMGLSPEQVAEALGLAIAEIKAE